MAGEGGCSGGTGGGSGGGISSTAVASSPLGQRLASGRASLTGKGAAAVGTPALAPGGRPTSARGRDGHPAPPPGLEAAAPPAPSPPSKSTSPAAPAVGSRRLLSAPPGLSGSGSAGVLAVGGPTGAGGSALAAAASGGSTGAGRGSPSREGTSGTAAVQVKGSPNRPLRLIGPGTAIATTCGPPPGLTAPQGLSLALPQASAAAECDFASSSGAVEFEATLSSAAEFDSFDEEVELLKCQAELVEAAAEIGGTTDDELVTTDADVDEEDDGLGNLGSLTGFLNSLSGVPGVRPWHAWQRSSSFPSAVIEEDEEGISSGWDEDAGISAEVGRSEIRSRLWAQSLLRLKRSIDEIYSLCEFESDEALCEEVRTILSTASGDFHKLIQQLYEQHEYSLMQGDYPFKTGVAWTTRTPRVSKSGESVLEQYERERSVGSPSSSKSPPQLFPRASLSRPGSATMRADTRRQRSPPGRPFDAQGGGTGEAAGGDDNEEAVPALLPPSPGGREEQLQAMVRSALERVHAHHESITKPSPEELSRRSEERQVRAQQLRAQADEQRMNQGQKTESRIVAARERRQEREQTRQRELLEKMTRARRQYQDQLRTICQKARDHNMKSAEVAFLAKESIKSEREILKQKQSNAQLSRVLRQDKMREKLISSAERVARVSENRKKQLESWKLKVQEAIAEKERAASARRREHINSVKAKSQTVDSRSEIVREKRRELQEEDEKTVQEFLNFRSKHIGRLAMNVDGLPDAIRDEVTEQLQAAVPALERSVRRSVGGSCARPKDAASTRSPPRGAVHSVSPKGIKDWSEEDWPTSPEQAAAPLLTLASAPAEQFDDGAVGSPDGIVVSSVGTAAGTGGASPEVEAADGEATAGELPVEDAHCTQALPGESLVMAAGRRARRSRSAGSAASADVEDEGFSDLEGIRGTSSEGRRAACLKHVQQERADKHLQVLRKQLSELSISDDEAYSIACSDVALTTAANTAHRTRLSKLAADLKKLTSTGGPEDAHNKDAFNYERADSVLGDFNKVLGQSQREADFALVVKLGCVGPVVEICLKIKDSLAGFADSTDRQATIAWRHISNVMLSCLKWLGLVCKHDFFRLYMLLTNRVVLLADVAVACLGTHSLSVLFLPQVLHVLSLHVRQSMPKMPEGLAHVLSSYLLLCGLPVRVRELFRRAEAKGVKLFEGASPLPLLLLRAMGLLGNLVTTYVTAEGAKTQAESTRPNGEGELAEERLVTSGIVLDMLKHTELVGIVSVLVSILLSDGRPTKAQLQNVAAAKLPQTVVSLCFQAIRILNNIARLDLPTLQDTLGVCGRQELYHLLVYVIDYCTSKMQGGKPDKSNEENSSLLHETIVLLGYFCLQREENQSIMSYGEGQTLLMKITSLPLYYFMDPNGRGVLFPSILATCFKSEQNLSLLRNEMNMSLLQSYISTNLRKLEESKGQQLSDGGCEGRFPSEHWSEALKFFSEPAAAEEIESEEQDAGEAVSAAQEGSAVEQEH